MGNLMRLSVELYRRHWLITRKAAFLEVKLVLSFYGHLSPPRDLLGDLLFDNISSVCVACSPTAFSE